MPTPALMPVYPRCGVRPVRGEGCHLIGERGERYLDFASGIAVNLLGHGHPHLVEAIQRQAATLMHVSNLYGSPQGEALAQHLAGLRAALSILPRQEVATLPGLLDASMEGVVVRGRRALRGRAAGGRTRPAATDSPPSGLRSG